MAPTPLRDPSPGSIIPHMGNLSEGRHTHEHSSAIVARGLVVRRGKNEVLHGLDLDVPSGRLVGLLGPSGSGKSTPVSYTHLRAHETRHDLVCRLLLEKKNMDVDAEATEVAGV